jgi:energy-coupling factor transporter ATP-binding protein EcfA2
MPGGGPSSCSPETRRYVPSTGWLEIRKQRFLLNRQEHSPYATETLGLLDMFGASQNARHNSVRRSLSDRKMANESGADGTRGCVDVFLGHEIEDITEQRFLRRLRSDLEAVGEPSLVLGNFYCGPLRTQIDFVVVTAHGAMVVEVKGYRLPVEGGMNGQWKLVFPDGRRRPIASKNPIGQAIDARYVVADELSKEVGIDSGNAKQAVGGNLCLFFEPLPSCSIPDGNFKCTVGGYRKLLSEINASRSGALSLDMWREFAAKIGLVQRQKDGGPSDADRFANEYASQWQDTIAVASRPFVPLSLSANGGEISLRGCVQQLQEGGNLLIVGSSGCGKSRILEELSTLTASAGMLPMAIEARVFDGNLRPLLERSVALSTIFSLKDVLRSSKHTVNAAVLFVDGFNECPPKHQPSLLRALFALHRRYGVQVVVASQREIDIPWLPNSVAKVPEATQSHLRAVLEAHLRRVAEPAELVALEVIASAHDAEILAGVMAEEGRLDGRFSLYTAYTRQHLGANAGEGHRALSAVAGTMRKRFASTVSEHELVRELTLVLDSAVAAEQLWRAARQCGLLVSRSGRVFFRHDLIADYFSTVSLLEECRGISMLAQELDRPINRPLAEFAVGGCDSVSDLETLLDTPTTELLIACIDGKCGARARSFVLDRVRDMLDIAVEEYKKLALELRTDEDGRHHLNAYPPEGRGSRSFGNYMTVVPHALGHGLLQDVMDAFALIDGHIWNEAERLRAQYSGIKIPFRRRAYNAIYSPPGTYAVRAMLEIQQGFMSMYRPSGAVVLNAALWNLLAKFQELQPGQLLIIVGVVSRLEPAADSVPSNFVDIIRQLWDFGIGRLRLEVVELVRKIGPVLDVDREDELRSLLNSWLTSNDPFTNGLVFDALQGFGGPETDLSVESAYQEFLAALDMPPSELAFERAMHMYVCTFDHPCDSLYCDAFHELLTDAQRQEVLLRAASATYSDLTTPMVIRELARHPTPDAISCFQKFAYAPDLSGTWVQSAVETYLLSIGVLANMATNLASPEGASLDSSAWPIAAELLYFLATKPLTSRSQQLMALWGRLEGRGVANAFDIVMHVETSFSFYDKDSKISFMPACANGVRRLARAALSGEYHPATEFRKLGEWHDVMTEHRTFALQVLGEFGRKTDLELVRAWTEDVMLGKHAIAAAKALESST